MVPQRRAPGHRVDPRSQRSGFFQGNPRCERPRRGATMTAMDERTEGRDPEMAQQTEPAPAGGPGGSGGSGGPWSPPPPRSSKRLYRRTDDKLIGGVASGLADYFDIDSVLVRIGFVILTIAGGAGVLAYLVMWWLVPPNYQVSNAGEDAIRRLKRAPSWVAIALLILGGVLLANQLGPRHGDIVWASAWSPSACSCTGRPRAGATATWTPTPRDPGFRSR